MRRFGMLGLAVGVFWVALAAAHGDGTDLERLQGTWHRVSVTVDGKDRSAHEVRGQPMVIKGDQYTLTMDTIRRGTVLIDPTTSPKRIDFLSTEGPHKGKVLPGIYKVEGNSWTYCIVLPGGDRPREFSSKPGSGHMLFVNERDQP
jgi:uncharacterized protein (TIGR03067 family)